MANWRFKIHLHDFFHTDNLTLSEITAKIVERVKDSNWYRVADEMDVKWYLDDILDHMVDAAKDEEVDEWNYLWADFYDLADTDRVWIQTR